MCFLLRFPVLEGAGRTVILINSKHERMIKDLLPSSSSSSTMSPSSLIGKLAPAFTLKNHDGHDYEFNPEGDTPTAIFFYPKSGTQSKRSTLCSVDRASGSFGCTREACQFRDALVGRWPLIPHPNPSPHSLILQTAMRSRGQISS